MNRKQILSKIFITASLLLTTVLLFTLTGCSPSENTTKSVSNDWQIKTTKCRIIEFRGHTTEVTSDTTEDYNAVIKWNDSEQSLIIYFDGKQAELNPNGMFKDDLFTDSESYGGDISVYDFTEVKSNNKLTQKYYDSDKNGITGDDFYVEFY